MHRAWFDGPFPQLAWIAHAANTWVLALRTWVVRSQLCLRVFVRSTEVYCEAVKSRFLDSLHASCIRFTTSTLYFRVQSTDASNQSTLCFVDSYVVLYRMVMLVTNGDQLVMIVRTVSWLLYCTVLPIVEPSGWIHTILEYLFFGWFWCAMDQYYFGIFIISLVQISFWSCQIVWIPKYSSPD